MDEEERTGIAANSSSMPMGAKCHFCMPWLGVRLPSGGAVGYQFSMPAGCKIDLCLVLLWLQCDHNTQLPAANLAILGGRMLAKEVDGQMLHLQYINSSPFAAWIPADSTEEMIK